MSAPAFNNPKNKPQNQPQYPPQYQPQNQPQYPPQYQPQYPPQYQPQNQPQKNPGVVDITSNTLAAQQMMGRGQAGQGFQPGFNQPNFRPNASKRSVTRHL